MFPAIHKDYKPVSREHHYQLMKAFIFSCKGLPKAKYEYEHILSDGVYIRKLKLPKGALIVGAVHKKETSMIILKGCIKVFSEDGLKTLKAGDIKISPQGTQRAGYAIEDTVLVTLHRADNYSLEEIVNEIGEGNLEELSGVDEGQYKLYINGRKMIDEKIQSNGKNLTGHGDLQRLLFD